MGSRFEVDANTVLNFANVCPSRGVLRAPVLAGGTTAHGRLAPREDELERKNPVVLSSSSPTDAEQADVKPVGQARPDE